MSLGPLMIDVRGPELEEEEREWLAEPAVGGVILFSRNYEDREQLQRLVADIHAVRAPPLLVAVDQEGGRVQRFRDPFTPLPAMRSLGHLYDESPERAMEAARAFGWLMAAELRAVGVDISFAPVVDLDRGLAEVIGDRAIHCAAAVVSRLAVQFAKGANGAGMAVTAKHFPSHAGCVMDSHTELAIDRREFNELLEDLEPYRDLISRGLGAVMVAHISYPQADPLPASLSSWWLKDQLREMLGFGGAIFSDDLAMAGASVGGGCPDRALRALAAGCDMVLLCNAAKEIPGVIDVLADQVNPSAQLHLIRLRGSDGMNWVALRASDQWRRAREIVDDLSARPDLELEG